MNDFGYDVWRVARINERAESYRQDAEFAEKRATALERFYGFIGDMVDEAIDYDESLEVDEVSHYIILCAEELKAIDAEEEEAGADNDGD